MRAYCEHCAYPLSTCICSALMPVDIPIDIYILQHAKEASHAKNTARLVALCTQRTHIFAHDDASSIDALEGKLTPSNSAILYPSDTSMALEKQQETLASNLKHLVLIDGSWRQAFGILKQYPWLTTLPSFHFEQAPKTQYAIRHTHVDAGLSTLEASAYALACLYQLDVSPLYKLQAALQSHWQGPDHHRRSVE